MAQPGRLTGPIHVDGTLTAKTLAPTTGQVTNAKVSGTAADRIAATKLVHQFPVQYSQSSTATVSAHTIQAHWHLGSAVYVDFAVVPHTVPTGSFGYNVDVQTGTSASGYASILSAVVTVSSTEDNRAPLRGTITTTTAVSDSSVQFVVATTGSTGTQGKGFTATLFVREQPSS